MMKSIRIMNITTGRRKRINNKKEIMMVMMRMIRMIKLKEFLRNQLLISLLRILEEQRITKISMRFRVRIGLK